MNRRFEVHVPLPEFRWRGELWNVAPGILVERREEPVSLHGRESELGESERRALKEDVTHWLSFTVDGIGRCTSAEIMNLVLLALWLVKSTRVHACFRFKFGVDDADGETTVFRLLDRFQWIDGAIDERFEDDDLQEASRLFSTMQQIDRAGRLNTGLVLTLDGCFQHRWQSALALFAAAAESLLTYSTSRGLTKRLANSYAILVGGDEPSRDEGFNEFVGCYRVRSDVVHGRSALVPASERIPLLIRWQRLLRRLWRRVLGDPAALSALEGSDAMREEFFRAKIAGNQSAAALS